MKRKKWGLVIYMACGIAISYLVRVNISHAIIPIAEEYSLNEVQQGMLLSAFAWGYVALMFIGGILVDKFGALKMSFRSAIAWSVCTAVSSVGFCWPMIFSSELLAGASEAPIFPANAKIVRNNFEENERGRATAIFDSGSYVGTAISAPLMSFLIINLSWRYAYIVIAIIGILWAIIWKQISKDLYDTNEITSKVKLSKENVFSCIVNRKVLGMSIGFFCYNYIKNFYLTWFPSYLVSEKGFSILKVGSQIHYARAFDNRGRELTKRIFSFHNDLEGFNSFNLWAETLKTENKKTAVLIGCEPTGHYWFAFAKYVNDHQKRLVMVNPFSVKKIKELDDNSPKKTDSKDPKTIAKLVVDGRYSIPYMPEGIYAEIRDLVYSREPIWII